MIVLANLPVPPPATGLVYVVADAWPGAADPTGFVMSTDSEWIPVPWASVPGFELINQTSAASMRSFMGLGSAATFAVGAFDGNGAATGAVGAHVGAADPHTTYFNAARGDARYAPLSHTHAVSDVVGLQTALDGKAGSGVSGPTARSLLAATAYQALTNTKPAIITVNLSSSAGLTLTSGTTNTAQIVVGATNGVAGGSGTVVGKYSNSLTGTLVVGLALNTSSLSPVTFALPVGWYFAVRVLSGTVVIDSTFDQALG